MMISGVGGDLNDNFIQNIHKSFTLLQAVGAIQAHIISQLVIDCLSCLCGVNLINIGDNLKSSAPLNS